MTESIKERRDRLADEYIEDESRVPFIRGFNAGLTDEVVKDLIRALKMVNRQYRMHFIDAVIVDDAVKGHESAVKELE